MAGAESNELAELNAKVTSAILRAEGLPPGEAAREAFREVSQVEQLIATLLPPDSLEGQIARRGAIMAALSAEDWTLMLWLIEAYRADFALAAWQSTNDEVLGAGQARQDQTKNTVV